MQQLLYKLFAMCNAQPIEKLCTIETSSMQHSCMHTQCFKHRFDMHSQLLKSKLTHQQELGI